MGFFDRFRSKPKDVWEEAYHAEPHGYQNEEGQTILSIALSAETDTVLPQDPKRMYKIKGEDADDFRLCFVARGNVIADLPFYSCIHALSAYVQELRDPYVLLRGISEDEMRNIIAETQKQIAERQAAQGAFEKNLEFIGQESVTPETVNRVFDPEKVQLFTFEDVRFPTGSIIVSDPICYLGTDYVTYLKQIIPAGKYPVTISSVKTELLGTRIAGMKMKITEETPVSYRMADAYMYKDGFRKDAFSGFGVDAGMAAFCDERTAEAYREYNDRWHEEHPDGNFYDDHLAELFAQSYEQYPDLQREGGDFIRYTIPDTEYEMVMAATGFGDGFYSVFWGYDEKDRPAELVTLFISPDLF